MEKILDVDLKIKKIKYKRHYYLCGYRMFVILDYFKISWTYLENQGKSSKKDLIVKLWPFPTVTFLGWSWSLMRWEEDQAGANLRQERKSSDFVNQILSYS